MHTNYLETQNNNTEVSDDTIGALALISMYQTITFFLLQILVWIPNMIVMLYLESQDWDESFKEIIMFTIFLVTESVLLFYLAKQGKKRFIQHIKTLEIQKRENKNNLELYPSSAFNEKSLEIALGITALAGVIWCLLIGIQVKSILYMFIVLEGAAFLFLMIFIIIRFLTTKKVRPTAIICLFFTIISLWSFLS